MGSHKDYTVKTDIFRFIRNKALLPFFYLLASTCSAQVHSKPILLPKPQRATFGEKALSFSSLNVPANVFERQIINWLSDLGVTVSKTSSISIEVNLVNELAKIPVNDAEGYVLRVANAKISIEATTEQGAYWAFQTLRQLMSKQGSCWLLNECEVIDWPAFSIRGFMHDVGRSFIPVDELKKEIKILSQFKINVFHWHLTEDIAWRLESRLFPQLTDSANAERFPGMFYSQEEAKDLMMFCKQHHVLMIPEIDMPGHSAAFRRALGCDMQSPKGMIFLKQLVDEVCEVFTDLPYLHIGTDEVHFTNSDFVPDMVNYIRKKGKKVISWNPGWQYKAGEIDCLQLWSARGLPQAGVPAIDSRYHYLNHFDTFADLVGLYYSNIAGVTRENDQVKGSILALWNDRLIESVDDLLLQNNFYPAMLTIAERTWQGGGYQYIIDRGVMMGEEGSPEFEDFREFEQRLLHYKHTVLKDSPFAYVRQTNVKWRITDPFPNEGNFAKTFPPEDSLNDCYQWENQLIRTHVVSGAGIYLRHTWGKLIPALFTNPQPNQTAYAYTWVYSPEEQHAGLIAGFQNYGRSEKDLPPPQGKWDYQGSRIWLNNVEIDPPVWENSHTVKSYEVPLRNENWEVRQPIQVTLQKGWNKLLIKLPVGGYTTPQVRLVKWMFTAVFVTPDGSKSLENIIYDPNKHD